MISADTNIGRSDKCDVFGCGKKAVTAVFKAGTTEKLMQRCAEHRPRYHLAGHSYRPVSSANTGEKS